LIYALKKIFVINKMKKKIKKILIINSGKGGNLRKIYPSLIIIKN